MSRMPENRAFPRLAVNCEIDYRPLDGRRKRSAVVRNISGNGVLLVAGEAPAPGKRMEITVCPGMLSIPALNAVIEVVRVEPRAARGAGDEDPPGPSYEIGARIVSMN